MKKMSIIVTALIICVQVSAQKLSKEEFLKGYNAILAEVPTIKSIENPAITIDTLAYLEQVVEKVANSSLFFKELQSFWINAGIIIMCNDDDQGTVLKESKNNLFIAFYDTESRYEDLLAGEERYISSYTEDGIIQLPFPGEFKSLDILSILLVHETMHVVFGGGELTPYFFETMAFVQFEWGRKVLDELLAVIAASPHQNVDYYQQCEKYITDEYTPIEEAALRTVLYICPQLVENKLLTEDEFIEQFRVLF